jgi:hypothetical protein
VTGGHVCTVGGSERVVTWNVAGRGVVSGVVRRAMRRHFHRRWGGGELVARRRGRGGHGGEVGERGVCVSGVAEGGGCEEGGGRSE